VSPSVAAPRTWQLTAGWLLLFVILSTMPMLKVGDIQMLEILQAIVLLIAILVFVYSGFAIPATKPWREYGSLYLLFLGFGFSLAVASFRLTFYPPSDVSFLKQPLMLSMSRLGELFLEIYFMLAAVDVLRRNRRLLRYALDFYWIGGASVALLSLLSALILRTTGVSLYFAYGDDVRIRGLFNEAGPYGLFLVSVLLVLLLRAHQFPLGLTWTRRTAFAVVALAMLQSASKAGFAAVIGISVAVALVARGGRRRAILIAGAALLCVVTWVSVGQQLFNYVNDYADFEEVLYDRTDDPSLIMGRIVGAIIVPRMIAAHPLTGIGIGNYSLMRNDPQYLQGLPAVNDWDLPGLGLAGSTAELGIPLTLLLLLLLFKPLWQAQKAASHVAVLIAASFQPIATLAGVNLNFFYPWLITAFAVSSIPVWGFSSQPRFGRTTSRAPVAS
jgi:hypothetical protein